MGDLPKGRTNINTDLIFEPALKNEILRDEIYCQIMKQLTDNRIHVSEERGWDLLWLATGVMVPSALLLKELMEFLRTRTHPLAAESLQRVQKTIKNGQRMYSPYIIEVEAIRFRTMQIYHKVLFTIYIFIYIHYNIINNSCKIIYRYISQMTQMKHLKLNHQQKPNIYVNQLQNV